MAQIVITDTFAVDRQTMWNGVADLDGWAACEDFNVKRLDRKQGKGARRRLSFNGFDMEVEVLDLAQQNHISVGATQFHNAPFKHFVASIRLAGAEEGPTSVALAIDFDGGLRGLVQKGRLQRAFSRLVKALGKRTLEAQPTSQVAA